MAKTVLVVDDDPVQRRLLEAAITKQGHHVLKCETGESALELLDAKSASVSLIILDLVMPGIGGMGFLEELAKRESAPQVIVQTAQGGIETVVNAMRLGAFDFVVKPVSPDKLAATMAKAFKLEGHARAAKRQSASAKSHFTFKDVVTASQAMQPVMRVGEKAAASTIPVLIEGESGVGKEMIAKAIHGSSDRASMPLVTVNCGALPENLVESLLFGHEKGAFTGATDKHVGKFEDANGGTLFLDEIGELPLDLQVKLLRALQEGEIDPVGAKRPVKVDVRLISATNKDLMEEVRAGRFREDLFYRLSVLPMQIPPLRERVSDIEPLVFHFIKKVAREERNREISAIRPEALEMLRQYNWPGNIRELENAIFRAMVLSDSDELTAAEFPQIAAQLPGFTISANNKHDVLADPCERLTDFGQTVPGLETPEEPGLVDIGSSREAYNTSPDTRTIQTTSAASDFGLLRMISAEGEVKSLEEIEGEVIRFAIEVYNGRMSEVARRLDIGRSTLYRKLKEHDITDV